MKKTTLSILNKTKLAEHQIANLSKRERESILIELSNELKLHKKEIFFANKKDIENSVSSKKSKAFVERLTLTESGFEGMINQLKIVSNLKDVLGETIEEKTLKSGINLKKIRFPLGVILMVYESRPNVTIDVVGLCIKSGNAVILKAGKESIFTNKILLLCIRNTFKKFNINSSSINLLEDISHEEILEILSRSDLIDVVIPRGSINLINAVVQNSKIPILYHSAGGARAYIDKSANAKMAIDLVINAKTQRNSVCNALDCVVIHKNIVGRILPELTKRLLDHSVEVRGDKKEILRFIRNDKNSKKLVKRIKQTSKEDFSTEFLDAIIAIKIVENADEGVDFIKKQTHYHTEMLVAEDKIIQEKFIQNIDASSLMINCSSRLHDGGEFEMGAEMGIATGKLHARGPVGLRELTTYKWVAYGNGQIKK